MRRGDWISIFLVVFILVASGFSLPVMPQALTHDIYVDALGAGWDNWSWATVNLADTSPVHGGSHSIAVTFGGWQGLYLHKAGLDTLGTTKLRFYLHGGGAGGQQMNVFFNLQVNGIDQNGPTVAVPPPPANSWEQVDVPLSTLNPTSATITGITWQSSSGSGQPTVYFDDISLTSDDNPNAPQITLASVFPRSLGGGGILVVKVHVSDPQGAGDVASVSLDGSPLGLSLVALKDDGRSNDGAASDGVYGATLVIPSGLASGERKLLITAVDHEANSASLPLGTVAVLDSPGGQIPASLPSRIGWGTNEWSETPGQDWQVNSGVPWNYVYQYITWGWESWGGSFVSRFVNQAWNKNYIPMVTVYNILGTPPTCGEGGSCYALKLRNASAVQAYLDSLARAAQEAQGVKPVIFNIEPDFYGYMQQLSNDAGNRPAGVRADDPTSYPVALNKSGYPNTLAGFGRYLVDMIHSIAPNALVAPMASMWATNGDPQSVTDLTAMQMGQRTAAFIDAMGGGQADLLIVEWSDRDAGSGLRPWWDDSDQDTPRPTRAILWENALTRAAGKRAFLWQMPVGNMALNNTCDHYQDNRAAYAFSHPRDLMDAGVMGILFGGGASCMTSASTDGGFVASQGGIAYSNPATPAGLSAGVVSGVVVPLRWNENSEPDLWGYRVVYRLSPSDPWLTLDVGRRNSINLLLPQAGTWEIRVKAYDAMGKESGLSAMVQATTNVDPIKVMLPIVLR
jgi:hypothetical protein